MAVRSLATFGKYIYYRCSGNRGKCDLPRFREKDIAERLGQPLKGLQVPQQLVDRIVSSLRRDLSAERAVLEARLAVPRPAGPRRTRISLMERSRRTSGTAG